jgi:hypothetical protein
LNRLKLFVEQFAELFEVDVRHRASIMLVGPADCQDSILEPIERH